MARYRAGYDHDAGLRGFDNHRVRTDVGSRGYDHGYRLFQDGGSQYRRPWVGGYHEGYQGGSEGIAMNTGASGSAYVRGEGAPWRAGYDRDYRSGREYRSAYRTDGRSAGSPGRWDQGDQGYMGGGGEYSPRYLRDAGTGYDRGYQGQGDQGGGRRYVRGRGGYDNGYRGTDEEYRRDMERNRPRYSPVGGMNPAMGGSAVRDRGYGRGYDGGYVNEWSRWF